LPLRGSPRVLRFGRSRLGCDDTPWTLPAYDATNLDAELWNSGMVSSDAADNAVKFSVPTIAKGRVWPLEATISAARITRPALLRSLRFKG
jgi:hypothetical protein